MRATLLAAVMSAALAIQPAMAEQNTYRLGSVVDYDKLVKDPDVTIKYVMYDPTTKTATLSVQPKDRNKDMLRIDFTKPGEEKILVVKNDCEGANGQCRAHRLKIRLVRIQDENQRLVLEEQVEVVQVHSN